MITANFSAYGRYVTDSLTQWDVGQVLRVAGLNLSAAPEVHFSNANMDRAIVRQASLTGGVISVAVPNSLLQDPLRIQAHVGVYDGSTFKVVELVEIPVKPRKRPLDYVFEDTQGEVYSYKKLENMIENITEVWYAMNQDQVQATVTAWLDNHPEATTTVQDKSITSAKLSDDLRAQLDKILEVSNIHNSEGFIQKIVDVCKTYTDNFDKLVYGNDYTAYDATTQQVGGKWQLDCSSFQNLLIRGVTFDNSKYAGKADNVPDPLFFDKFNPYECRNANTMAKWLYENGYTFEPAADFSNIEPGDLVFYSWPETTGDFHENAFMHIDHVAMFLQKKNDTRYQTIQYEQYTPNFFYDVDEEYMSDAVLVARLPFPMIENNGGNLVLDSHKVVSLSQSTLYTMGVYRLSKPMIPGKMYTCCFTGKVESKDSYFVLRGTDETTLYTNYGEVWSGAEKEYKFSFICPDGMDDYSNVMLVCAAGAGTTRTATGKNLCLYEGYKRTFTDSTVPVPYPIFRDFSLAANIKNDLDSTMVPSCYVLEFPDYYFVSFNIPTKTLKSGNVLLGSLGAKLSTTRRLPANLVGKVDGAAAHYNGFLQISGSSESGDVYVNTWSPAQQYQYIMANGVIAK